MCGIAAVYGEYAPIKSLLLTLNQLERGTKGCGIAYITDNRIKILKEPIHPILFSEIWLNEISVNTKVAIAHNRLPSIGKISYENTHPFLSCDNYFAFAHNGHSINHTLRPQLTAKGHEILGETDSEILMHLLEDRISEHIDIVTALQDLILTHLNGTIEVLTKEGEIYLARSGYQPLHYTIVENEVYAASSATAIKSTLKTLNKTVDKITAIQDGEIVIIKKGEVEHLPSIKPKQNTHFYNLNHYLDFLNYL